MNTNIENCNTELLEEQKRQLRYEIIYGENAGHFAVFDNAYVNSGYLSVAQAKALLAPAAMTGASASAAGASGLVPAPAAGAANRYLRSDGSWQVPPDNNTTYAAATQSANGLMSAADKKKLDGIAEGAGVNTDTHYVTRLLVGAASNFANAATANGATYLKAFENHTLRDQQIIHGARSVGETSDENGNIKKN